MENVVISVEKARRIAMRALTDRGLPEERADDAVEAMIEADLRGRPTHGLFLLPGIAHAFEDIAGSPPPELAVDRGPCACIEGHGYLGYPACAMASREAAARAKEYGFAIVGARNVRHMGFMGYYVDLLAREELFGMAFADCVPLVAPHGGVDKALGTNPITAAFPWRPYPILVDLATSAITYGAVRLAILTGGTLPEGVVVGPDGKPSTDPMAAREGALLPMAGHKGYALGLMAQMLSGVITLAGGLPIERDRYGFLVIAGRIDVFGAAEEYYRETARLVEAIKQSRRADGVEEILLPGERSYRERERRLAEGIELTGEVWESIRALFDGEPE